MVESTTRVPRLVTLLERADVERVLDGDGPSAEERAAWVGTTLVSCAPERGGCGRAAIVRGAEDVEVMLELVDDQGWAFGGGFWRCGECTAAGVR